MGSSEDIEEKGGVNEPLLVTSPNPKGGFKTLPFILALDNMEKSVTFGLHPNMIVYLMRSYGLEMATGSNILFWWAAATNFAPILGAYLADTYVGRFRMIGFGSILSLTGMMLLWSTTMVPGARPLCNNDNNIEMKTCSSSATPFQLAFLCSSFGLMSIGAGGIRSSTPAFGADQVVNSGMGSQEDNVTHQTSSGKVLVGSFFNWYCFSMYFSTIFALTVLVYIQEHMGWKVGFGVPLLLFFLSVILFFSASSIYVKAKPNSSLLTGFAQVIVASWRNRGHELQSQQCIEVQYHVAKGSTLQKPSAKLRLLNKACIIKDPRQDLTLEGTAVDPWQLCTVDQVEEFKSVLNIVPIWSTGVMLSTIPCQTSFQVLQANSMDRHFLSPSFEIPAGSFGTFAFVIAILWIVLYDRVIIPLASKAKGKPTTLSIRTRMGVGFLLSIMSMVVAAVVESVRRDRATRGGRLSDYPSSTLPMSAMWLAPQVCLSGLGEAIGGVAQIELFYSELPRSMSSIAASLFGLGMGIASLVASLIMSLIDHLTKRVGKESWVSGDVNKGHYDYYYWVLAGLSLLNFMYFLLCSRAYWQDKKVSHETKETGDESLALKF